MKQFKTRLRIVIGALLLVIVTAYVTWMRNTYPFIRVFYYNKQRFTEVALAALRDRPTGVHDEKLVEVNIPPDLWRLGVSRISSTETCVRFAFASMPFEFHQYLVYASNGYQNLCDSYGLETDSLVEQHRLDGRWFYRAGD